MAEAALFATAVIGTAAQVKSGVDARKQARKNAAIQEETAMREMRNAKIRAENVRKQRLKQIGTARVAAAMSGRDLQFGTAAEVLNELTNIADEEEAFSLIAGAEQAQYQRSAAQQSRAAGDQFFLNSLIGAGSTILSSTERFMGLKKGE